MVFSTRTYLTNSLPTLSPKNVSPFLTLFNISSNYSKLHSFDWLFHGLGLTTSTSYNLNLLHVYLLVIIPLKGHIINVTITKSWYQCMNSTFYIHYCDIIFILKDISYPSRSLCMLICMLMTLSLSIPIPKQLEEFIATLASCFSLKALIH